jgi:hypothetical protein
MPAWPLAPLRSTPNEGLREPDPRRPHTKEKDSPPAGIVRTDLGRIEESVGACQRGQYQEHATGGAEPHDDSLSLADRSGLYPRLPVVAIKRAVPCRSKAGARLPDSPQQDPYLESH